MQVSGHLHVAATLLPPYTGKQDGWTPERTWTVMMKRKIPAKAEN